MCRRASETIAQGEELLRLGIWTGGAGVDVPRRLSVTPGGLIWHDAAYWVMPLVWYSGMRREEACKLLIDDIGEEDGIIFVNIRKTSAGGVKNATSVRKIPICDELRRLGFLHYVEAMKEAGEQYLFPEIQPGRAGRALGDVFFKNIWPVSYTHLDVYKRQGRSQAVRQRFLVPPCAGSNPAAPASRCCASAKGRKTPVFALS